MKHLIKSLLLTVLVTLVSVSASAYDFEVDGIYYNVVSLSDLTCEVTYKDSEGASYTGDVKIPSTVTYNRKTLSVTSVGEMAFRLCPELTSVEIPNSVIAIGASAFARSASLNSVKLGSSVTSIGKSAFFHCASLASIEIPNSVTSIGSDMFAGCTSLTSIGIPNSVTNIEYNAFYGCTSLASIEMPNSVTGIGNKAFYGCTRIVSIDIPNSVKSIGKAAFSGCTNLASIEISNSVKSIEEYTFHGCTNLVSVGIPNSVMSIDKYAFSGCTNITSIYIPNSVTSIEYGVLDGCTSLTSVKLGNGVTDIGTGLFDSCTNLDSICIGNSYGMRYLLKNFNRASVLTIAKDYTDEDFPTIREYKIGNVVYSSWKISDNANLKKIICKKIVPPTITDEDAISNSQYMNVEVIVPTVSLADYQAADVWKNFWGLKGGDDEGIFAVNDVFYEIETGNKVTIIGNRISSECNLVLDATVSYNNVVYNVSSLSVEAFKNCSSLTSITVNGIATIGVSAFDGCENLNTATLSNGDYIGCDAFSGCSSLTSLSIDNIATIGESAFYDCENLSDISLSEGVLSLGESCFYGDKALKSISIPPSLTNLPAKCFSGCSSLQSIDMEGVQSIGDECFCDCNGLKKISLPSSLTQLGSSVFKNCNNLKELRIEDSPNAIEFPSGSYDSETRTQKKTINGKTIQFKIAYYNGYFAGLPIEKLYIGRSLSDKSRYTLNGDGGVDPYVIIAYDAPFNYLPKLTELTIGKEVTTLGPVTEYISKVDMDCSAGSFNKCGNIKNIVVECQNPPTGAAFTTDVYSKAELVIPDETTSLYEVADGWKEFLNRRETGITELQMDETDGTLHIYDLQGRKLSKPQKGINIINGKKVVVN